MNDFLGSAPFDLYQLHLFHLVVRHGSFTRAAETIGITQSAITRQIQNMENSLGVPLLERTTRSVRPTEAGRFLNAEAARVVGDIDATIAHLREAFAGARKTVRIGISRTISTAYLPGFFHANQRRLPEIEVQVVHGTSREILDKLELNELDLGVICPPARINPKLKVTHRFTDDFTLITPASMNTSELQNPPSPTKLRKWIGNQSWLLLDDQSFTGQRLRAWLKKQRWDISPQMQFDEFDMIASLVSLGMGVSLVPQRALAPYNRRRLIQRVPLKKRFSREVVVLMRRHRKPPAHLEQFVENILF